MGFIALPSAFFHRGRRRSRSLYVMSWIAPTPLAADSAPGLALAALPLSRHAKTLDGRPRRQGISPNVVMLRGLPLLRPLSDKLCSHLAAHAEIQVYGRGERVVEQGQIDDLLYVFLSGRAYATRTGPTGRDVLFEVLEYGAHIGELGLIDGEPHAATVRCVTPCKVLLIPGAEFLHCMGQSPELTQLLTQTLVKRLRLANHRIASLALQDVRARVLNQLAFVAEQRDGQQVLPKTINRTELACTVGASREMVSRIIKALLKSGTLEELPGGEMLLHPQRG